MKDGRIVLGYGLITAGALWTLLGGMCVCLNVIMTLDTPDPGTRPDWTQASLNALWLLPGLAAFVGGILIVRAVRRSDRKGLDNG